MDFNALSAQFPRDVVEWRSQSLNKNGDRALALAYIDARAVMNRLDEVCGPANWQTEYVETLKGRVLCRLGIRVDGEWIWKSDGAGATAVEGDKGAISDSLKRAAVQWGIGRYLYDMDSVWVACESYEKGGKRHFSRWTEDPWSRVRVAAPVSAKPAPQPSGRDPVAIRDALIKQVNKAESMDALNSILGNAKFDEAWSWLAENHPEDDAKVSVAVNAKRDALEPAQ